MSLHPYWQAVSRIFANKTPDGECLAKKRPNFWWIQRVCSFGKKVLIIGAISAYFENYREKSLTPLHDTSVCMKWYLSTYWLRAGSRAPGLSACWPAPAWSSCPQCPPPRPWRVSGMESIKGEPVCFVCYAGPCCNCYSYFILLSPPS